MNNETNLRREFREHEVNRMRNIITGKSGDKTQLSSGYETNLEDYKEGDVWEDVWGKTWTIQNGIKRTVTKNSRLKELAMLPMSCPNCGNLMKVTDLNKKMWAIHRECFDCIITRETRLKSEGKWEEYERSQMTANIKTSLEDFEAAIDQWYSDNDTFVTEAGDVEAWSGGDKAKIYEELKANLKNIKHTDIYNIK
jgi:hypothetical protein